MAAGAVVRALRSVTERPQQSGVLVAAAGVGGSFGRGLLPRSTGDQAVLSGTVASLSYGVTTLLESVIEAAAERTSNGSAVRTRQTDVAINALALAAGFGLQEAFEQRPDEHWLRPAVRTAGFLLARTATAGTVVAALEGAVDYADGSRDGEVNEGALLALDLLAAGGFVAAMFVRARRRAARADRRWPEARPASAEADVSAARALGMGAGVTAGLTALAFAESAVANGVSHLAATVLPGGARRWRPVGHLVSLGLLGGGVTLALQGVMNKTEEAGESVEPASEVPPTSQRVSGGPNSLVDWSTLGREGRRFVSMQMSAERITEVVGAEAVEPVRAYVGLDTVSGNAAKVDLMMRELEQLGAFERSVITVFSPTGSGYVNYVALESLEYMTMGDCASLCVAYSVRPSFLSLAQVDDGRDQVAGLLARIHDRIADLPEERRPRLHLFGESLGCWTSQDVFGTEGPDAPAQRHLDRVLWVGTPWFSTWHRANFPPPGCPGELPAGYAQVDGFHDIEAMDQAERDAVRYVFLTHHNDPIAKVSPHLLYQAPPWLGPPEERALGVPRDQEWRPVNTAIATVVDVKNAMTFAPGRFFARGHDYRADLARMTRFAFGLDASDEQLAAVEAALEARELRWAERRFIAEQRKTAIDNVTRQLKDWGVDDPAAVIRDLTGTSR